MKALTWILFDWVVAAFVRRYFDLISLLNEKSGVNLCLYLVKFYLFFQPRLKRATLRNISFVYPELTDKQKHEFAKASYRILAENLFWFSRIRKFSRKEMKTLFDYREAQPIYDKFVASPVGGLIITPHFGLFELLAQAQAVWGRPFTALVREFGMPRFDKFWRETRERFGLKIFGRKGGFNEMIDNLNSGLEVAVLFDQNVKRAHAAFVDLFGIPAATTKSIAIAAIRTNCPIVFTACLENKPEEQVHGRFKIYAKELMNPNIDPELKDKPYDEKIIGFLRKANQELEALVGIKPENWFWIHRRWKTRPVGEKEDFYD